ncbi:MAG: three-Cys-motif partner protein TcmP [Verrucomicrobia bacterium]|nr:three-Cys-motif partner protein TcmP [Verrucomicrobiota bacterium]
MPSKDFHNKPFDEGTLTKLNIFELYTREWLPVFLSQENPPRHEIHIYDFFAGPGMDSKGIWGSPLRILRQLKNCQVFKGWNRVSINIHFFDKSQKKIDQLNLNVDTHRPKAQNIRYDIRPMGFTDGLKISEQDLANPNAAKLVFIDQTGVANVTDEVFRTFVNSPSCDFLFFISSSTLHRFREHPAIRQKIVRPKDYYHIHRAALDYYRNLLPSNPRYFLAPFSIKKGSNIYGVIFGSAHPRGMDKFLQVAWKSDEINGEADFDINRANIIPGQLALFPDEIPPSKTAVFEAELESLIRNSSLTNELDVIQICFEHGMKRQHAEPVLKKLKREKVIDVNFRVPDISRHKSPRPIHMNK